MWDKGHPWPSLRPCGGPCTSLVFNLTLRYFQGIQPAFLWPLLPELIEHLLCTSVPGTQWEPKGKRSLSSLTDKSQN